MTINRTGILLATLLSLQAFAVPGAAAQEYYDADGRGNVNQVNIGGVGEVNRQNSAGVLGDLSASEKRIKVDAFSELVVRVPAEVTYTQGSANEVKLIGPASALQQIQVTNRSGRLLINSKNNFQSNGRLEIQITGGSLNALELSGAIDAQFNRIRTTQLVINLQGAVDLTANGHASNCSLKVSGSSDADLEGLKCSSLEASLQGSGDLQLYASERISGTVGGAADVYVSGSPKQRQLTSFGAVDIYYD